MALEGVGPPNSTGDKIPPGLRFPQSFVVTNMGWSARFPSAGLHTEIDLDDPVDWHRATLQ